MAARTLILLRHAKSDWSGDPPDLARPLGKRGRRQAPEAGQWLAAGKQPVDLERVRTYHQHRVALKNVVTINDAAPPPRHQPT